MREQLLLLVELQECDSQLMKIADKKKTLPGKINKLDEEFLVFQKEMERNKKKYDEAKAHHIDCENKIKKINEGMIRTKERLLEVKNNKEYQAMLKEIGIAEVTRGDVETEIISILDELENLAVLVKKDQTTLDEYRKKYEEEKKRIEGDLNSIDTEFFKCEQKRAGLKDKVLADILARYEKIKKRNNGVGVTSAWKSVCNGCHMNIPPQLYIELQKTSELIECPNCQRIMYFREMEKPT